jgi:hypothetical protein
MAGPGAISAVLSTERISAHAYLETQANVMAVHHSLSR